MHRGNFPIFTCKICLSHRLSLQGLAAKLEIVPQLHAHHSKHNNIL